MSTNNSKTGDDFVYCYQKFDGFDVPMLIVADPDDNYKVYGCYQYLTDNGNIAIYTSHFRYCKWLCNEGCFKSWSNGPAASTYYRFYWSERPAGFSELSAGQFYLTFTDVNRFEYGADSKPGMFTDASGAQTSMSINDGRARIDSLHSLATGITWHKIVEEFVEPPTQKIDISQANVSIIPKQDWTGSAIEPKPIVSMGNKTLNEGTDYTLSYENNVGPGTATIIIAGIGDYSGWVTTMFEIGESIRAYLPSIDGWGFSNKQASNISELSRKAFNRVFPNGMLADTLYMTKKNSVAHGLCEGLAITSALTFTGKPAISTWRKDNARRAVDLVSSDLNRFSTEYGISLSEYIQAAWCYQFTPEANIEKYANSGKFDAMVSAVDLFAETGANPIVIVIRGQYENSLFTTGHDLVPYKVERTPIIDRIYVYDCNSLEFNKGVDNSYIELTKDSSGKYTGWSYELWPGLTWGSNQYGSMITYYQNFGPIESALDTSPLSTLGNYHTLYTAPTGHYEVRAGDSDRFRIDENEIKELRGDAFVPILESNIRKDTRAQENVMWYCDTTAQNIGDDIRIDCGNKDTAITGVSATGGVTVHVRKNSIVDVSVKEGSDNHATILTQNNQTGFEISYFKGAENEDSDTLNVSGLGSKTVRTAQVADGVEVCGASELVIRNCDARSTRAIELDANKTYTVLPGDENTDPEIVGEASDPVLVFDQKAIAVAAGGAHSAAILEDGSLWTWGCNDNGQLGDGTYEDRLSPVKIMEGVTSVALGSEHSAAIKSDGSLWVWGRNRYGSLGDGTTVTRTTPVKAMEGVAQVSCGNGCECQELFSW